MAPEMDAKSTSASSPEGDLSWSEHVLESEWTVWHYPRKLSALCQAQYLELSAAKAAASIYERDLIPTADFGTVEDFFRAWEVCAKPSNFDDRRNVAVFRRFHKPMWEAFPNGGRFVLRARRSRDLTDEASVKLYEAYTDRLWDNVVLYMIGEMFELPEVIGSVISLRARETVISLWVTNADHQQMKADIRQRLRKIVIESRDSSTEKKSPSVAIHFESFHRRLRDQERGVLAKLSRSSRASVTATESEWGGSVCTTISTDGFHEDDWHKPPQKVMATGLKVFEAQEEEDGTSE